MKLRATVFSNTWFARLSGPSSKSAAAAVRQPPSGNCSRRSSEGRPDPPLRLMASISCALITIRPLRYPSPEMSLEQLLETIPVGSPDEALAREVNFDALPAHIAIIMDGNGRWAAQRHLPRVEGHRAGIEAVRDAVETSARLGIGALTLYAFSVENW